MSRLITRVLGRIRGFFTPHGRHRAGTSPFRVVPPRRPVAPVAQAVPPFGLPRPVPAPTVRPWYEPIDGASTALVRPYLQAYDREEKARLQRLRRDSLWCATYGIDLDTRDIHAHLGAAS